LSCSPTSRPAAAVPGLLPPGGLGRLAGALVMLAAALYTLPGCKDDLADPTEAQVHIRFVSSEAGLGEGARVTLDGTLIRSSLAEAQIDTLLSAGPHTIVFSKTCVAVEPSDTLSIQVEAGVSQDAVFNLSPASNVLVIDSDPAGLPFRLNGEPAGQTPASFVCLEPGPYEVSIPSAAIAREGFDLAGGDTLQVVQVPVEGRVDADFTFSYAPREQIRGVLLELFTATLCPNCPKADEAAEDLENDPAFQADALAAVQVHLRWMGSDPFYTQEIEDRVTLYGGDQSAPYALFSGQEKVAGSSTPDLLSLYKSKVLLTYGQPAQVGLYWSDVDLDGDQLTAHLRFVAIDDLASFEQLRLHAFVAKDSLIAMNPYDVPDFDGVVRDYIEPVSLDGVRAEGSYLDRTVEFNLAWDSDWETPALHLVGFVQEMTTHEIIQCREVRLQTR
jgi:hypothetical protein